jgi:hypothetical protein
MSDWRTPYAALWEIAGAATIEDLERLWVELDGPAQIKAFRRRTWKFMQSPLGRPWHGARGIEKGTVRDPELREAMDRLYWRIKNNPILRDRRALILGSPGDAILNLFARIAVWDEKRP